MIDAAQLTVSRANRAILRDLTFSCAPGEFVALLGLNGAGKSTLLETLCGLLPGYSGHCRVQNREVRDWPRAALSREISFLPQTPASAFGFTVRQVVAMGRYPHSGGWTESPSDRAAIDESLAATQCHELSARPIGSLSGGERQRALLAAALCQQTPILALDEPSAHADLPVQARLFELLRARASTGALCLAAVHDLNAALAFATRAILLHDAAIAFDGPPAQLLDSPVFPAVFGPDLAILRDGPHPAGIAYRRPVQ